MPDTNVINDSNPAENVDKKMVDFVTKEFTRYENFHRERFDKMKRIYDRWKNKPIGRDEPWQNQVNVPVMLQGEQTVTPRLFTALFPNDAPIDVKNEGDTPADQANRIKALIQHYFRVNEVQVGSLPTLTQNTLFGTGYAEAGMWKQRYGWIHGQDGQRKWSLIENRPGFSAVDFFEVFPHPAKIDPEDALPLIRRRYVDSEVLKKLADAPGFKNLKEALDSRCPVKSDKDYQPEEGEEYELLEYWGPHDEEVHEEGRTEVKKGVPFWMGVINRTVLVKHMPNPYNHQCSGLVKTKLFEDATPSWFGYGLGEAGLPTQERLNKLVNQRLDNVDLVLNKQGFYNGNDTLINTKRLEVSKPGQWHKVSDTVTSIRWMETPDVTQSSYNEEKLAKDDFREATGAVAQLMPSGEQHRTAMGINLLTEAAGMRFRPILRRMETHYVQRIAMYYFSNLKQFMSEAQWVQITGKNGEMIPIQVTPEQIQAKVFFVPTGISETVNKEIQVTQLLKFKEITKDDPTVNRHEINRRIAELMGFKDVNKLIVPGQPVQNQGPDTATQLKIQQRVAEGATPDQIKQEVLGPRPSVQPVAAGGQ